MRVNPEACRKICHHLRAVLGGVEHPCKFTILAFFLLKGMFYFIIYLKTTLPKTLVYRLFCQAIFYRCQFSGSICTWICLRCVPVFSIMGFITMGCTLLETQAHQIHKSSVRQATMIEWINVRSAWKAGAKLLGQFSLDQPSEWPTTLQFGGVSE